MNEGKMISQSNISRIILRGSAIPSGERIASDLEEELIMKWTIASVHLRVVGEGENPVYPSEILVELHSGGKTRYWIASEDDTINVSVKLGPDFETMFRQIRQPDLHRFLLCLAIS